MKKKSRKNSYPVTQLVAAVASLQVAGNVIPRRWYSEILLPSGKPDLVAITILAEIVYWYRPIELAPDPKEPTVTLYARKFKSEFWQCSYSYWHRHFGLTKRQCQRAMQKLEELKLAHRQIDKHILVEGKTFGNVMYLVPVPAAIRRITAGVAPQTVTDNKKLVPLPAEVPPEEKPETTPAKPTKPPTAWQLLLETFAKITGMSLELNAARFGQLAKLMLRQLPDGSGYGDLREALEVYYTREGKKQGLWNYYDTWRAQRNTRPSLADLRETFNPKGGMLPEKTKQGASPAVATMQNAAAAFDLLYSREGGKE